MDKEQIKEEHQKSHVILHHQQLPYMPSHITCLSTDSSRSLIAIGKNTGIVEIYNYPTFTSLGLYISIESPIRSIHFMDNNEFVVFYLSGQISVFDTNTSKPINSFQLPLNVNIYDAAKQGEIFVCACSDGTVRKIQLIQNSIFQIQQTIQLEQQCLSVTIHLENVFASFSDGCIRSYVLKNLLPQSQWAINIAINQIGKANQVLPWKITIFNNHLFIGLSNGSILVYETRYNTQIQQIKTHDADILCLLVYNGTLYASGVDSKIISIVYNGNQYSISGNIRGQSHDIYALQILQNNKLISGGINTDICMYQLDQNGQFDADTIRHRFTIPQPQHFQLSHRFLAINKFNSIDILQYSPEQDLQFISEIKLKKPNHFIKLQGNLICYAQEDQTIVLRIDNENQLKKIRTLPYSKNIEFHQKEFYLIDKDDKLMLFKMRGVGKFKYQLLKGYPKTMEIVNKKYIIITYPTIQRFVSIRLKDFNVQEIDCQSNQNLVTNICSIRGKICSILVTYASQAVSVYNYNYGENNWMMCKYSRDRMFQSPLNYKILKDPIKGVILDPQDPKRLLLYTNNSLVKLHLRGTPPKEAIETRLDEIIEKKTNSVHDVENFQMIHNAQFILGILKIKSNEYLILEWDKENTFKDLPLSFDGKKYHK